MVSVVVENADQFDKATAIKSGAEADSSQNQLKLRVGIPRAHALLLPVQVGGWCVGEADFSACAVPPMKPGTLALAQMVAVAVAVIMLAVWILPQDRLETQP